MHKFRIWLAAIVIAAGLSGTALAADQVNLAQGQTSNNDYFAAAGSSEIAGTVNGDAYVAGGTIVVSGTVKGDLLVAGGTVTVSGRVDGSIRATGGTLTLNGSVGRNVTIAGGTVTFQSAAKITGNVLIAGGTVATNGVISGNLGVTGGNLTLAGTVNGHVKAQASQVTVLASAVIGSGLEYISKPDATIAAGAKISGDVKHTLPPVPDHSQEVLFGKSFMLWKLAASLVVGFAFLLLFPRFASAATERARKHTWKSLGIGLVFLIVIPIVAFALMFTVVGIELGVILFGLYILGLLLGQIIVALYLSHLMTNRFTLHLGVKTAFLVGALVYWLLCAIPYVGGFVSLFGMLLGFGALMLQARTLKQSPVTEDAV